MKQQSFRILFFIAKKRLMKNGEAPVYLRITIDGISDETRIKRSVPVEHWNQSKECSRGKSRGALELNEYIRTLRQKAFSIHKELVLEEVYVTAKIILGKLFGGGEDVKTLLGIFREHNQKCRQLIGIDYSDITVRRYDNCAKYIGELIKLKYDKEDLTLKELNGEFIREFEFYMKTEKSCQQNTVIRYMKCFKKITNLAIANEWMTKNPFAGIKFREQEVHKEFLTWEEINAIHTKEFEIPRLDLIRDIFIFCCWSGLAFIDVQNLRPEHIIQDNGGNLWIRKTREKTNNMCNIPLLSIPSQILEKYRLHPICQKKGVLLPVMCNQKMNSYLKEIADFCGIEKDITTHTARHTFATTVTLANGVALTNVARMLGHTSTRMTEHYAKVLNHNISSDMKKVQNKMSLAGNF